MASAVAEVASLLLLAAVLGCDVAEPRLDAPTRPAASPEPKPPEPPSSPNTTHEPGEPPCTLVEPPSGFVDLRAHIPSAIIVAGYHRSDNFTGARLPGYDASGAWLSLEAADALARAAQRLEADGMRLIIYDAYRPQRAAEAMVDWCRANDRMDLLEDGWVAARSAHSRGIAIDVGLADAKGRALEMGSAWDQFDRSSHVHGVDGPALELRLRLRDELVREGFEPYAREWWHFTHANTRSTPARDVVYACTDSM